MKNLVLIILFFILSQNCIAKENYCEYNTQIDTIAYSIRGFNSEINLLLFSNNEFIKESFFFDCVSKATRLYVFGEYQQKGSEIQLIPKKVREFVKDSNNKSKKDATILYKNSNITIKTKYYQVELNGEHYLLSNEFIKDFTGIKSKTNDFQELVIHAESKNYGWASYFIAEKEPKFIFTSDDLPKEYQKLLKPLMNKIYSVQLGVFKNPENFGKSIGKDFGKSIGKIYYLKTDTDLTIILIGKYNTYKEAKLVERKIELTGREAIIVALKNSKKVPL